jgi:hypothetical protein
MKKRIWSILLALCMALSLLPVGTLADDDGGEKQVEIDLSDVLIQFGGSPEAAGASEGAALLESNEQLLQTILHGLELRETQIDVSQFNIPYHDDDDSWARPYWQVVNTHPELFYVSKSLDGGTTSSQSVSGWIVHYYKPTYNDSYTQADSQRFLNLASSIVQPIMQLTAEQKCLYLHDYLVTHCHYDPVEPHAAEMHNAYNALVNGVAVCEGYALAYTYLINLACAPNEDLSAVVVTSDSLNHAWNLLTLGGARYYVDCTWDDPTGCAEFYCRHTNFLRSRSGIASTEHTGNDWLDPAGNNVYNRVSGGTKYDSYFWSDVAAAIPMTAGLYAYAKKSDNTGVFLRDAATGTERKVAFPQQAQTTWYVVGSTSSYWPGCYASVVALDDTFYFNTPTEIYSFSADGVIGSALPLAGPLQAGYIYGLRADPQEYTIYYYVGANPNEGANYERFGIALSRPVPVSYFTLLLGIYDGAVNVTVLNGGYESGAKLITAVYDEEGKLLACTVDAVTGGETAEETLSPNLDLTGGYMVRAFVVDANTFAPLGDFAAEVLNEEEK